MAKLGYAGRVIPASFKKLGGGLNSTSGPLGLTEAESSDLRNVNFDKFGSVLQRNGYTALNTTAITSSPQGDGLHWFEYFDGSNVRQEKAVKCADGKVFKMDALDGTWDDITVVAQTATNQYDFETFRSTLLMTNNVDTPSQVNNSLTHANMTLPTGTTKAKFVTQFQNYTILANVETSGTRHGSRFHWSTINTINTWNAADALDVATNDGKEITGCKVLGDRLVLYKDRSIYVALFTGNRDFPFIVVKTNSPVGCTSPYSIQEVENGHIFKSYDGIYFFDGNNAYKISQRIRATLDDLDFDNARSMYQHNKNRYWLSCTDSVANDTAIVWDSHNNAFSIYKGMRLSAMAIFWVNGTEERPYFSDYAGFTYRADIGADDYPLNVQTAIDSYFYTNWKNFDDIVDVKRAPHTYLYHQLESATLDFSYSYDFENDDQYTLSIDLSGGDDVYGTATYGSSEYAQSGGNVVRQDLTGRGRVVRYKFANNRIGETWQVDGIGVQVGLETNL